MGIETTKKPWYKISKDVEYSTDFKFFKEHQVVLYNQGTINNFCSRIETKCFRTVTSVFSSGEIPQPDADLILMQIHREILSGKHGTGELVD